MHNKITNLHSKYAFCFLIGLFTTGVMPLLAQSSARPSPVEVICPKPPMPVEIEGKNVLVYELHLTNFGPSSLKLAEIQVFDASDSSATTEGAGSGKLADYSGPSLVQLLHSVAEPMRMKASSQMASALDSTQLEIGHRVIAFMYISVPSGQRVSALRHRFLFDVADSSRAKGTPNDESALDDIMVPVLNESPPVLRQPMGEGIWYAGNGPSNTSDHRRSVVALNGRAYIAQRFATDWMMIGPNGNTFHDNRSKNENFWGFGQPLRAVADGEVTAMVDDLPDHLPDHPPAITLQNIAGNYVILRLAPGIYAMFAHLKQGSIRVRLHQQVNAGEVIGELGDSGQTTGPHFHFQLMDANSPLAAEGLPYVFDKFRFLGFGKEFEMDKHPDQTRSLSLPMDDTVLSFQ